MTETINELQKIMNEDFSEKKKISPQQWAGFVEGNVVNFFDEHKIEKLSIEDGNGNKAKLAKTKDNGIKIEYSSTVWCKIVILFGYSKYFVLRGVSDCISETLLNFLIKFYVYGNSLTRNGFVLHVILKHFRINSLVIRQ